ncbi:MAG: peptidyl-prolyl cis-trans isomerase [Planctomycetes bacterium]|nr:peptidyl-prolyl cis-trans isomerase [Planctomycetota bacterium]
MVLLSATDTARITFNTPAYDATSDNELEFELQVTDGSGRFATDRVVITVTEASGAADGGDSSLPRVKVRTSLGDFVVELDQENAPITVANFLEYVNDRFYDGTIFHRVIPAFVVQGGGFTPGMVRKDTRDPIVNEASNGLKNDRGTIAMARTNDPDSATSQFYVNLVDNDSLNASGSSGGYAVFGKVVSGMDVVDLIATVETTSKAGANDVPVDDVKILGVTLIETEGDSPV